MDGSGRGEHGHFAKGHRFSKNNKRSQRLRWAAVRHVTPQDIREVVEALLTKAKAGDVPAARELLNRVIGKPVAPVEVSGPDGTPLGVSMADVQLAVIEALSDEPTARIKVAASLKALHDRSAGNGSST